MRTFLLGSVIFAAVALQGCSTTHTINIAPTGMAASQQYTNQQQINYSVKPFASKTIGEIETGLRERAKIVIGNDTRDALDSYIGQKLEEYGLTPNRGNQPATILMFDLTQLSYQTHTIALKTEAKLVAELQATVVKGEQRYTAKFKSEKIDQYGTLPDREAVEQEINKLLGKTVDRALNDGKLIQMLSH
ncbi:hypothetical protein MAQ5080_02012 [Marinomonas aquimarina]|uniref:Lipoprotein n=1 Tax=Marinomonas aquimarina TaxID=295068 RepID=A0A1A8TH14_9GAMM|nr:YajG family lipoprotein [Marinomonas aquimarina]SBS31599.1 hypothetical protein MAQ5080_02012 [Marinomonas aquimarina]